MQFLSFNLCAMHFICFFFQNSFSTYNPNFNHNYACFICQSLHKSLVRMHSLKCTWPCYTTFLFLLHCIFSTCFTLAAHVINILIMICTCFISGLCNNLFITAYYCIVFCLPCIISFFQMSNLYLPISLNSIKIMIATHTISKKSFSACKLHCKDPCNHPYVIISLITSANSNHKEQIWLYMTH